MIRQLVLAILLMSFGFSTLASGKGYIYDLVSYLRNDPRVLYFQDSKHPDTATTLDCGSFFHNIKIEDKAGDTVFQAYLESNECFDLNEKYKKCVLQESAICIDPRDLHRSSCLCE